MKNHYYTTIRTDVDKDDEEGNATWSELFNLVKINKLVDKLQSFEDYKIRINRENVSDKVILIDMI